jgi:hypothetical protein
MFAQLQESWSPESNMNFQKQIRASSVIFMMKMLLLRFEK